MKQKKTVKAGKFKATCLALIDEVHQGGNEIIITKYGKPVARLTSLGSTLEEVRAKTSTVIKGDIISPLEKKDWGDLA